MKNTMKIAVLVAPIILCQATSYNEVRNVQFTTEDAALKSMEGVFRRSEEIHEQSMASIMRRMSLAQSLQVVEASNLTTPAFKQATISLQAGHLRQQQPKGYSGLDGARKMLNDMIYESMSKYDGEIAKCTEYYSKQCAAMEVCRGKIAAANYVAANSRALILDSQATINKCEVDIPTTKLELKQEELKCEHELSRLNKRLKIVMGDIAIMTTILEMTDCEAKSFLQNQKLALLRCEASCSQHGNAGKNAVFVTFNNAELRRKMSQLQSSVSHDLMQGNLADMFDGIEAFQSAESSQASLQVPNKTAFNNPPVPVTKVPGKPGPYPTDWVSKCGCHMGKTPMCYKLQGRFLLIQAGIQDERDNLLASIQEMENVCETRKQALEKDIEDDENMLAESQTKLAGATEKEANAGEIARQTAAENGQLNSDLESQMKACSGNYINFETEICALKKIRGELYKMKGGSSAFFQDCEVTKWEAEECTKVCASGEQKLERSVLTNSDGGAKCLPLEAMRSCNNHPCPVDCKLATWSGWSKCSADCGGGVQQRLREVKVAMRYKGTPCGVTSESKACNSQACEKDCELTTWTAWSFCSKDCDGGTKKRERFIKNEALGAGGCPDEWSQKRLEYKNCAMNRCKLLPGQTILTCNKTMDIVLLLDGSAPVGAKGFKSELNAANMLIDAFSEPGAKANVAVILFSGPRTWSGVSLCTGKSDKKIDSEKDCGLKTVTHFTDDLKKVKQLVTGLDFPKGGALTSLALLAAKAELSLGRPDATSNVIIFTAGRPLSYRKTEMASNQLRKSARLFWVPVSDNAPLKSIKKWATRRWQENVVTVTNFTRLENPEVITHIVANLCPKRSGGLKFSRR